jgi:hypothetical protein
VVEDDLPEYMGQSGSLVAQLKRSAELKAASKGAAGEEEEGDGTDGKAAASAAGEVKGRGRNEEEEGEEQDSVARLPPARSPVGGYREHKDSIAVAQRFLEAQSPPLDMSRSESVMRVHSICLSCPSTDLHGEAKLFCPSQCHPQAVPLRLLPPPRPQPQPQPQPPLLPPQ